MTCSCVAGGAIYTNDHVTLMARVRQRSDGTALVQSDFGSIAYTVERDGVETVTSTSLTVNNVILDTLQTDALWTVDSTGYNFQATLDHFATAGSYRVKMRFTESGGAETTVVYEFDVEE